MSALVGACRRFASQKAAWGITTVQGMGTMVPTDRLVAALDRSALPIRVEIYRLFMSRHDVEVSWAQPFPTPLSPRVGMLGAKWILDGTQVVRGAYLREPYAESRRVTASLPSETRFTWWRGGHRHSLFPRPSAFSCGSESGARQGGFAVLRLEPAPPALLRRAVGWRRDPSTSLPRYDHRDPRSCVRT